MQRGKRFLTFAVDEEDWTDLENAQQKLELNRSEVARRALREGFRILREDAILPGSRRIKTRDAHLPGKRSLNGER